MRGLEIGVKRAIKARLIEKGESETSAETKASYNAPLATAFVNSQVTGKDRTNMRKYEGWKKAFLSLHKWTDENID